MPPSRGSAPSAKRRRTNLEGNGTDGGSAVQPKTDPKNAKAELLKSLSPRLEPMREVLEAQPKELLLAIIDKAKSMLDLVVTIRQRCEGFKRFAQPWVDPTTGEPHLDAQNQPRRFIPNSLREKCPIKISDDFNDDDELQDVLRRAQVAWQQNQDAMALLARCGTVGD